MTDNFFRLIPADPTFVPDPDDQRTAGALLRAFVPLPDEVTMETTEEVRFIDQGSNFEGVYCPACSADLDQWWKEAMDRAWQTRFANLAAVVPCCGSATSLNDLRYVWPAGFARFVLEAKNPGITDLAHHDLAQLETTLGCRLRRIWAHY